MDNTSYVALSRQNSLWKQMEVVANNMANLNTVGFKAEDVMMAETDVKTKSDTSPFGRQVAYVHDLGTVRDTKEGPLSKTGAPLDVAIHGSGYFTLDSPGGARYTRAGHFRLDENGMIVSNEGLPVVQASGQPIIVAPNEAQINIASDGTVSTENGQIGQLKISSFANEQDLKKAGDGTYITNATATTVARPELSQGMLEDSNVEAISQMTQMLTVMRSYQSIQNILDNEQDRIVKAMPILSGSQQQSA
jgi:flagellar basal-body rod protein FlgF